MSASRPVRLYRDGPDQAVHIPREFELPGEDATIRKEGARLIIEAAPQEKHPQGFFEWLDWLQTQPPLGPDDQMPEIEDHPPRPVNL